jgi:hypothetical protein
MDSCEPMTAIDESREAAVPGAAGVSAVEFREAMGHFATGVTVVTSIGEDGEPVGTTANAVTSLSLDPPLLLVCFDLSSATLQAIRTHGAFVATGSATCRPTSPGAASPRRGTGYGTAAGRPAARCWTASSPSSNAPWSTPCLAGTTRSSSVASGTSRPTATARPPWCSGAAATRPSTRASPPSEPQTGAGGQGGQPARG